MRGKTPEVKGLREEGNARLIEGSLGSGGMEGSGRKSRDVKIDCFVKTDCLEWCRSLVVPNN